jgi:hypothetical protein
MRVAWLFVVACTSPPAAQQTTPSIATAPADASVDAPVDAAVDAELAAAPPWIFRFHTTGLILQQSRLETWTLRFTGGRATILVERKIAEQGQPWADEPQTLYIGTGGEDGFVLTTVGNAKLDLACKRVKLDVAAPTAVRKPHPRTGKFKEPCSGDPGRWVPAKTTKVDVLSCKLPDIEVPMPFAAAPGVEYLFVNDDCDQQGGDYRAIAADGSVAPVR